MPASDTTASDASTASADGRRAAGLRFFARFTRSAEETVEPELVHSLGARLAEDTLRATGAAWGAPELSDRDRSISVLAALVTLGVEEDRLRGHVLLALENGVTQAEIEALVALLAVYAGFPRAASAARVVRGLASVAS